MKYFFVNRNYMALFDITLPVSQDYIVLINDIVKLTVSLLIAFLVFKSASSQKNFMDIAFLELYMYLLIGCAFYHLLVREIVEIK